MKGRIFYNAVRLQLSEMSLGIGVILLIFGAVMFAHEISTTGPYLLLIGMHFTAIGLFMRMYGLKIPKG